MSIEAMKLALEALEELKFAAEHGEADEAITALRAAIEQAEKQEPVAWLYTNKLGGRQVSLIDPPADMKDQYQPLYLVQPQANNFNPDWDAIPVMVEEQQRMAKRIEELEAQLGEAMWGYGEWRRKAEISSALCTRQGIRLMEYESQSEQEPVAYGVLDKDGQIDWTCDYPFSDTAGWPDSAPLYTAPPQREWVGLTDAEMFNLWMKCPAETEDRFAFARAIEAKLKEKNT